MEITPPEGAAAEGVLVATLWGTDGQPLAERLIYRAPARTLRITVTADRPRYTPGGKAVLKVKAVDEEGRPAAALVGLAVSDDSVLEMIEKREQAPRLPGHGFCWRGTSGSWPTPMSTWTRITQGRPARSIFSWARRAGDAFATSDVAEFLKQHGDDGRRALAQRIPAPVDPAVFRNFGVGDDRFLLESDSVRRVRSLSAALPVPDAAAAAAIPPQANPVGRLEKRPVNQVLFAKLAKQVAAPNAEAKIPFQGDRDRLADGFFQANEQLAPGSPGQGRQAPARVDRTDHGAGLRPRSPARPRPGGTGSTSPRRSIGTPDSRPTRRPARRSSVFL